MKLIIRDYLASLKERGELDVILPDLLSQMGLNVYSRAQRGTRQDGVDAAAVGSLDGGPDRVYLFTLKPGDLARQDWDGNSQALRSSLNEILDTHIRNRIPEEHRDKPIVICIALGGDVLEPVRVNLTGFIEQHTTERVRFEEWNGDKLAQLIQDHFLREDLLPSQARSHLRKAVAMVEEPDIAVAHFTALIRTLADVGDSATDSQRMIRLRQMSLCLSILFAWARDAGNTESAYRGGEFTLLHAWEVLKVFAGKRSKTADSALAAFFGVFTTYQTICSAYLDTNITPYAGTLHGVSAAVRSSEYVDVNLKLFDVLGRLALDGLWSVWGAREKHDAATRASCLVEAQTRAQAVADLIANNPVLLSPLRDDQAIDINLALMLLAAVSQSPAQLRDWIGAIVERTRFAFQVQGPYPCTLDEYADLLAHPQAHDDEYRQAVTGGSILYPVLAIWAALLGDDATYEAIAAFKSTSLEHCNFQYWYPDDQTESCLYTHRGEHGAVLSDLAVDRPANELLTQAFGECDHSDAYKKLSAVAIGWWPLVLVACRLYRLPPPLDNLRSLYRPDKPETADAKAPDTATPASPHEEEEPAPSAP